MYVCVGPTEFLSEANGYPLRYDGLEEITQGAFRVTTPHTTHSRDIKNNKGPKSYAC